MSKKDFTGDFNKLLGDSEKQSEKPKEETSQVATEEEPAETRATFIVNVELLEKIKAIAYWERKSIKEVVDLALNNYVDSYEKKNGSVKPKPTK